LIVGIIDYTELIIQSLRKGSTMKYVLTLYIAGHTPRSEQAIRNLRRICEHDISAECEIIIVDVLEQPKLAEEARVLATPTLIKEMPLPVRRIIGDLSDTEKVLKGLSIAPMTKAE
jgi:circadian clock protein KaiB